MSTLENFIFMIFSAVDLDALSDSEERKQKKQKQMASWLVTPTVIKERAEK